MTDEELQEMIDEADRDGMFRKPDPFTNLSWNSISGRGKHLILTLLFLATSQYSTILIAVSLWIGDGEINEEEFYRIMKKTSLF